MGGTVDRTLTSAELLGAFDAPVELIPAPGEGRVIMVTDAFVVFEPGDTPYTGDNCAGVLQWGDEANTGILSLNTATTFGLTDATLRQFPDIGAEADPALYEGESLGFAISNETLADGNGTLRWILSYRIIEL